MYGPNPGTLSVTGASCGSVSTGEAEVVRRRWRRDRAVDSQSGTAWPLRRTTATRTSRQAITAAGTSHGPPSARPTTTTARAASTSTSCRSAGPPRPVRETGRSVVAGGAPTAGTGGAAAGSLLRCRREEPGVRRADRLVRSRVAAPIAALPPRVRIHRFFTGVDRAITLPERVEPGPNRHSRGAGRRQPPARGCGNLVAHRGEGAARTWHHGGTNSTPTPSRSGG